MLSLQIAKANVSCPPWFSSGARNLIKRILDPNPQTVSSDLLLWWPAISSIPIFSLFASQFEKTSILFYRG